MDGREYKRGRDSVVNNSWICSCARHDTRLVYSLRPTLNWDRTALSPLSLPLSLDKGQSMPISGVKHTRRICRDGCSHPMSIHHQPDLHTLIPKPEPTAVLASVPWKWMLLLSFKIHISYHDPLTIVLDKLARGHSANLLLSPSHIPSLPSS